MDTNSITRNYLDSLLFEQRLVDSTLPDIHVNIFGETFDTPVMTPAFSHLKAFADDRESAMIEYAKAAAKVGALNWFGMEPDDIAAEILDANPRSVRVIKPFADQDRIIGEMEFAADHGALAVGIDIDHVYGYDGQYDVVDDIKMGPISTDDLRKFVTATKLPLIIKGVLSVRDAVKCAAAGVKGIVVSHHHGRLPFAVPPLNVLPAIAHELKGSGVTIFVDCHMDTGYDALKAIALGADAVSVGNAMMKDLKEGGVAGVTDKLTAMNHELITGMGYTGCKDISQVDASILWKD